MTALAPRRSGPPTPFEAPRRFVTYYPAGVFEVQNHLAKGLVGSFDIPSDLSYQFAYDERIVAFPKGRPRKAPK